MQEYYSNPAIKLRNEFYKNSFMQTIFAFAQFYYWVRILGFF